jgi:Spy/CpxP family protein refolding chaperone
MKIRLTFTVVGLLSVLALSASLSAQTGQAVWPGAALSPLGLSPEQQGRIQDIVQNLQAESLPLWTDLQTKSGELMNLLRNPNADPSIIETKQKEVSDLQAEIQRKSLEARNAIRSILTDQQKTLFDQAGLGYGWGRGPCGLGLGAAWGGGRGFARGGGGWGRGFSPNPGAIYGPGPGMGTTGWGLYGPLLGRGPCGMGLGRAGWASPAGRWPW